MSPFVILLLGKRRRVDLQASLPHCHTCLIYLVIHRSVRDPVSNSKVDDLEKWLGSEEHVLFV